MKLPINYIKAVHATLNEQGVIEQKQQLVFQFTDERTTHVHEMNIGEARELLRALGNDNDPEAAEKRVKMIRTIYSLAYQMNMTCVKNGETKVDTKRLDELVTKLSPQKKGLQAHTAKELTTLVTIVKKYYRERLQKGGFYESTGA